MGNNKYFEDYLEDLKKKYPFLDQFEDYKLFIYLYIKYFFYNESESAFDPELIDEFITDGKNDGGIDAIFNDSDSSENDLIILQSKYYKNTKLKFEDISAELCKIKSTLSDLEKNKISEYRDKLVTAYRNATSQMGEEASIKIIFCTSYMPKDKRERNKLDKKIREIFSEYDVEILFNSDIKEQIEFCESAKPFVDNDYLEIDDGNNYLKYEDSVIVNISALSLQRLENKRRNGLLGMNLRYYVRSKNVDSSIEETVKNDADNFWYKNNGILIICDDYEIKENRVELTNFSIVNGGQTTNRIGHLDIEKDFYLQGKIVKSKGNNREEKDQFSMDIAKSTNTQKPIREEDLKSNRPEQSYIKERLSNYGIYYVTKKGDKVTSNYKAKDKNINIREFGKMCMSSVLQMPGSARSNPSRIYAKDYYKYIYDVKNVEIVKDAMKIGYYYDEFLKTDTFKSLLVDTRNAMKNAKMHQIACISLLSRIANSTIDANDIMRNIDNEEKLKELLRKSEDFNGIIFNKVDKLDEKLNYIFQFIGSDVLNSAYFDAKFRKEDLVVSNFLKTDSNYYTYVIRRLINVYQREEKLREHINELVKKK